MLNRYKFGGTRDIAVWRIDITATRMFGKK